MFGTFFKTFFPKRSSRLKNTKNKNPSLLNCNKLTIFHQNIQYLSTRIDALVITIEELKPDIVILSENKLTINEIMAINITGFKIASYYVRDHYEGGGVLILVSNGIEAKSISSSLNEDKIFESCAVEIALNKVKLIIAGVYRTPSRNVDLFIEKFDLFLSRLRKINCNIIVGGDFNIDVLIDDNKKNNFVNVLNMHNMYYMITIPTRVTEDSETALDNFVSNIDRKYFKVASLITALSDHDGQLLTMNDFVKFKSNKQLSKSVRVFNKENISRFITELQTEDWTELYQTTVTHKFSYFYNVLKYFFYKHFPKVNKRIKNKFTEWVDDEIKFERKNLINNYHFYRQNKNEQLQKLLKRGKKQYRKNIIYKKILF